MSHGDQGKPNIFPFLRYQDAPAALRWLSAAFGFEEQLVVPGPDGTIAHAEMRLGAGSIMLGTLTPERRHFGRKTAKKLGAVNQGIYVCVDDIDAHYAHAKAAGAEILQPIQDEDHGRGYVARDPEGNLWSFGSYMPGRSREQ